MTSTPADPAAAWRGADPAGGEQPHALIELRGHVLIVTMNRPQARNALSGPMMAIMQQAWDQVDNDPQVRVVHPDRRWRRVLCGRRPEGDDGLAPRRLVLFAAPSTRR